MLVQYPKDKLNTRVMSRGGEHERELVPDIVIPDQIRVLTQYKDQSSW